MIEIHLGQMPPRALSPNACRYAHWSHRAKARKEWHDLVYFLAVQEKNGYPGRLPYHKARLTWTFVYRLKRKRDADNLLSSMKCGQDALVQAGIIEADDTEHLILMTPVIIVDPNILSETIVKIEEVA